MYALVMTSAPLSRGVPVSKESGALDCDCKTAAFQGSVATSQVRRHLIYLVSLLGKIEGRSMYAI